VRITFPRGSSARGGLIFYIRAMDADDTIAITDAYSHTTARRWRLSGRKLCRKRGVAHPAIVAASTLILGWALALVLLSVLSGVA